MCERQKSRERGKWEGDMERSMREVNGYKGDEKGGRGNIGKGLMISQAWNCIWELKKKEK